MPLYEYECTKCGHVFEVIQKFSDPPRKSCPRCKGKLRKLPSAPAIQFKGSGWYVTDYGGRSGTSETEKKEKQQQAAEKSEKAGKSEPSEKVKPDASEKASKPDAPPAREKPKDSGKKGKS